MPRFRNDLDRITAYKPGKPIEAAARELGMGDIVKLASNECPLPPFPEVLKAIGRAAADIHRYPDNEAPELRAGVAEHLSVPEDSLVFGTGSASLMMIAALALGGPDRSIAYCWPSFGLYRIAARTSFSTEIEVPLTDDHCYDLDALAAAIRPDTSLVYLCNPNNPTGTYLPATDIARFIDQVPSDVLVIVDEAYFEYVQAADFGTAVPIALERDNVLVARTFSKVYGLAGLRVGYAIGNPATIADLRRVQVPFSVNSLAQAAATEALRYPERVAERVAVNTQALKLFSEELAQRSYEFAESHTNFIYMHPRERSDAFEAAMAAHGVIVRDFGHGWKRVTMGTDADNARFFAALDSVG